MVPVYPLAALTPLSIALVMQSDLGGSSSKFLRLTNSYAQIGLLVQEGDTEQAQHAGVATEEVLCSTE